MYRWNSVRRSAAPLHRGDSERIARALNCRSLDSIDCGQRDIHRGPKTRLRGCGFVVRRYLIFT